MRFSISLPLLFPLQISASPEFNDTTKAEGTGKASSNMQYVHQNTIVPLSSKPSAAGNQVIFPLMCPDLSALSSVTTPQDLLGYGRPQPLFCLSSALGACGWGSFSLVELVPVQPGRQLVSPSQDVLIIHLHRSIRWFLDICSQGPGGPWEGFFDDFSLQTHLHLICYPSWIGTFSPKFLFLSCRSGTSWDVCSVSLSVGQLPGICIVLDFSNLLLLSS